MAADIFGAGLDRDVDAVIERPEVERARPGIVHQHDRVLRMRRRGDRRDVLHLEGERARRLGEHSARVRLQQKGNAVADARVVVGRRHAQTRQHGVAERARRAVGAVGHQQVVAGVQHRKERGRDRGEAGRRDLDPGTRRPLHVLERLLQSLGGRRAAAAVMVGPTVVQILLDRGIEQGRGVVDRRVDITMMREGIAAGDGDLRVGFERPRAPVIFLHAHPLNARRNSSLGQIYSAARAGSSSP